MTLAASILEADMLPDEQTGRFIIKLFADIFAELLADFAAARAQTLGFGQLVFQALAGQFVGRPLAAVPFALGAGGRGVLVRSG